MDRLPPDMLLQLSFYLTGKNWLNYVCCSREIYYAVDIEERWFLDELLLRLKNEDFVYTKN